MTLDQGNTFEYKGVTFQHITKGVTHCKGEDGEWCGLLCYSYMAHARWHATNGTEGEAGY